MEDVKFNAVKEFAKEMKVKFKGNTGAMAFIDLIEELDSMKIEEVKEVEKESSFNISEYANKNRKTR